MPYENVMGVNEKQYRHASTLTNDMACPSTKVFYFLFAFCAMPQPSQIRAGISEFCATTVLGSFESVYSSACSAHKFQSHRIQFWEHFVKSRGALKQLLECMPCNCLPGATRITAVD